RPDLADRAAQDAGLDRVVGLEVADLDQRLTVPFVGGPGPRARGGGGRGGRAGRGGAVRHDATSADFFGARPSYSARWSAWRGSYNQQRDIRSGPRSNSGGSSSAPACHAYGQRGSNLQPFGIRNGFGTTPLIADRRWPFLPCDGIDSRRPRVYGWRGLRSTSS